MRLILLLVILASFSPEVASAEDPWIGTTVFFKDGAKARIGEEEVEAKSPTLVDGEDGDWLIVGKARVRKSDAMSARQAIEEYGERI